MTWLVAAFALLKRVGTGVITWLTHASFWQLVSIALAIFAVVQHFQIADARHDRDAYHRQRDEYRAKIDSLAAESKQLQDKQKQTITRYVTVTKPEAEKQAKRIEDAPVVQGECKTPDAVMRADI